MKQSLAKDVPREILGFFWPSVKEKLPKDFDYEESIRKGYMEVKNITRAVKDWTFETQFKEENLKDKRLPPSLLNKAYIQKYIRRDAPRIRHELDDPAYVLPPRRFQDYDREVKEAYKDYVNAHGYIGWKDWYAVEGKKIAKKYLDAYRGAAPEPHPALPVDHNVIIVDDIGYVPAAVWEGDDDIPEEEERDDF